MKGGRYAGETINTARGDADVCIGAIYRDSTENLGVFGVKSMLATTCSACGGIRRRHHADLTEAYGVDKIGDTCPAMHDTHVLFTLRAFVMCHGFYPSYNALRLMRFLRSDWRSRTDLYRRYTLAHNEATRTPQIRKHVPKTSKQIV